jgi:hypothetical protein
MFADQGPKEPAAERGETPKCSDFVVAHEAGVADDVCGKNGGQPAFQSRSPLPAE